MPRWSKIALWIVGSLLALLVIIWCSAAYYINQNNKKILATILTQLNSKVSGDVKVGSMETTLLQGFPGISVSLKDVLLRDSLWTQHKHDLLNAKDIEVSLNALSLLTGTINIRKVGINNAKIYVLTDSTGYSNTSMFKTKSEKKAETNKESTPFEIRDVRFHNVDFVLDNQKRFKNFNFHIEKLNAKVKYPFSGWDADVDLKTTVQSFAFNTKKGSFLKDKELQGNLIAHYNEDTQVITIEQRKLSIGGDTYMIGAKIDLAKNNSAFQVDIKADEVLYQNIAKILSPNISVKLLKFAIEKPIAVTGHIIDNGDQTAKDPKIDVQMTVKNNKITIPSGVLTDCSFIGTFSNKDVASQPISDENSAIKFFKLKANYYNAPITVDTFRITNLARPIATGLVKSKFDLAKLNESIGGETYKFNGGTADLQLFCQADIENFMFTKPNISGNIAVKDADILYVPRNMHIVKSSLLLNFNQKDLSITGTHFQLGKSAVDMTCYIQNFLNFYYTDPNKVVVNLDMKSPQLYISEFMPFLGPRKGAKKKVKTNNSLKEVSDQLSAVLEAAKIQIKLTVGKAIYNKFVANNLNADISLQGDGVHFNKIGVNHAGGYISFTGDISQRGTVNKFRLNTDINNVNVKDFFYAFDDFGQKGITHKNLKGLLSAKVNAQGSITDKGNIVKRSMYGTVNFNLKKAALVNFSPLETVQKMAFANRDFSNITMDNLNGRLTLNGDKIMISPMQVNTSVLNFDVKGTYGLDRGTDIAMDIPLRNPKKSEGITDKKELKEARMKGIVLHLKALDDGQGGLKIRWNGNRGKEKES